jgi:hypothetical protein
MKDEDHEICLFIDNFSGHKIAYEPQNILLEFFKLNLTLFVQPLDAGIIQCFKVNYQKHFSHCAIDLDEVGEHNIYKINILEGMLMARDAWTDITQATIEHCWDHTKIQPRE